MLDWELSTLGDPLADFSYHLMQWHMPRSDIGADTGSLVGCDLAALGIPSLASYVERYVARTGLDPRPHLTFYLAYNFFRLAAIVQGIVGRVRDGTATSEHAAARVQMVRPLAEKAWEFCAARTSGRRRAASTARTAEKLLQQRPPPPPRRCRHRLPAGDDTSATPKNRTPLSTAPPFGSAAP